MLFGSCLSVALDILKYDDLFRISASKALPFTFAVFVVSASLKGLFVVPGLSHESTFSLKEILEESYRRGVLFVFTT
ncbi:hypothetical protein Tco_0275513 [Tanacetum coccineum]